MKATSLKHERVHASVDKFLQQHKPTDNDGDRCIVLATSTNARTGGGGGGGGNNNVWSVRVPLPVVVQSTPLRNMLSHGPFREALEGRITLPSIGEFIPNSRFACVFLCANRNSNAHFVVLFLRVML